MTRRDPARDAAYRSALLYPLFLIALMTYYFLRQPIERIDTDLWYHLTGGRYIWTHLALPHDSFFSFLAPPRPWVDYYWLFQTLVYGLYALGRYQALIIFRAALYLGTSLLIVRFLSRRSRREGSPLPWLMGVSVCYCLALFPRHLLIRPHAVTYAALLGSLALLELWPRRAAWLPLIAVLWCNMHGITYPLVLLVSGAYLAEGLLRRWRKRRARAAAPPLWPLLASMGAVLMTPHGLRLLRVPWVSTAYASDYVNELQRLEPMHLVSFHVKALMPTNPTIINLLLLVVVVTLATAVWQRTVRLSHLVLCLGGLALLTKGTRFTYECLLLALPLLRAHPLLSRRNLAAQLPRPAYLIGAILVRVIPLLVVFNAFEARPAYPFSARHLPQGTAGFLRQLDVGGTVFQHPNTGGYWQWMLYPRYRIWMDMEVPFLFTDDDFYLTNEAFHEATALRAVLQTYHPDFVAAPANRERFPDLIKAVPDYVPVFFDDEEVLYASAARHPALVERYALHQLRPFTVLHQSVEQTLKEATDPAALRAELERMLAMDPDGLLTNELTARLLLRAGDVERARPLAETLIRRFPDVATGYQLRGEVLQAQGRAAAAIAAYEEALQWCDGDVCRTVARQQAGLYLDHHQPQPAYQLLRALAPLFQNTSSRDDLYHLAVAARLTGRRQEAARILRYLAAYRVAPEETEWVRKLRDACAAVGLPATGVATVVPAKAPPSMTETSERR